MSEEEDVFGLQPQRIVVSAETWEWLQAELARPPKVNPKMVELLQRTRGTVKHR